MTGQALDEDTRRICLTEGCGTVLSRSNSARICAICSNRLEIGGARIPLPPPTIVPPRPPAPARPVLEGAVPLPGVVKGPQRTYAEMIQRTKPAAAAVKPLCAECGEPLPKGHEGWLCRLCIAAAALRLDAVVEDEPAPKPAETAAPARVVARKITRRGSDTKPRKQRRLKIDQVEAARIYRETGGNLNEVARRLGVAWETARTAVYREIDADEREELKRAQPRESRRVIDRQEAVRLFRESGNARQVSAILGFTCVRKVLIAELGETEYLAIRHRARVAARSRGAITDARDAGRARAAGSAPSNEATKPEARPDPPANIPPLTELEAELSRLELELEHVASELGRLYHRQGAASKRMTEVIALMAASARNAA